MSTEQLDPLGDYLQRLGNLVSQTTKGYDIFTRIKNRFLPDWTDTEMNLLIAIIFLSLVIVLFKVAEKISTWKKYSTVC